MDLHVHATRLTAPDEAWHFSKEEVSRDYTCLRNLQDGRQACRANSKCGPQLYHDCEKLVLVILKMSR